MKKLTALLLSAMLLASLCACSPTQEDKTLRPTWIFNDSYKLTEPIALPDDAQLPAEAVIYEAAPDKNAFIDVVYRNFELSADDVSESTDGNILMLTNDDCSFTFTGTNGVWQYSLAGFGEKCGGDISDEDAAAAALAFVEQYGLYDGELRVGEVETVNGDRGLLFKQVYLYPTVNVKPVRGLYCIMVSVNAEGTVGEYNDRIFPVKQYVTAKLKTADEVKKDIDSGNYTLELLEHQKLKGIKVTDVELAYYPAESYLLPIYIVTAEGTTPDGERGTLEMYIDAQA